MPPVEDRNDRERSKAIEMAVGQIEKQFGKGSIMRLGQKDAGYTIPAISTGAVSLENLLVSQPDNGEQALEIVEVLVRSGAVDVVVVDSVAALVPRAEIEGEMGEAQM